MTTASKCERFRPRCEKQKSDLCFGINPGQVTEKVTAVVSYKRASSPLSSLSEKKNLNSGQRKLKEQKTACSPTHHGSKLGSFLIQNRGGIKQQSWPKRLGRFLIFL